MLALQVMVPDRAGVERLWRRWSPGLEPPPEHLDAVAEAIRGGDGAPARYYRAIPGLVGDLGRSWLRPRPIEVPVLYLHGVDDGCIGPAIRRGQRAFVADRYEEALVAGAGHFLPLERPEAVADLALRFLAMPG